MSCTLGAGLTWVVPVRPDDLGDRLDRYTKALPQLHALRMCHRFGTDSGITKLPIELEQAIEDTLVHLTRPTGVRWQLLGSRAEQFACFESRCAPMAHMADCYSPLSDAVSYEMQLCGECEDDVYNDSCERVCNEDTAEKCTNCKNGIDCLNRCENQQTHRMNVKAMGWESWQEVHMDTQSEWWDRIRKSKGGGFHDHMQTLEKHLGLSVVFHNTRIGSSGKKCWPIDANYEWHDNDSFETTLCFLTLPDYDAAPESYNTTEMEDECGMVHISAARAIAVPMPDPAELSKTQSRFQRALRILDLRPYIHPAMDDIAKPTKKNKDQVVQDESKNVIELWETARCMLRNMMPHERLLTSRRRGKVEMATHDGSGRFQF
ncbi:hypothetical protein LTR22_021886 [Elasticomyces elasticus]|nr:hypothetical protein LTR22_021886 [Elasticomyces elasticus]